jgi:plasmid stability protein
MSEKPIRDYDRLILRLPDGMREALKTRAELNARSMNAEAVAILERALQASSAEVLRKALVEYERSIRGIKATEARQQELVERRDTMRAAIVDLMPDERAADAIIRAIEARQGQYDEVDTGSNLRDVMKG